MSYHTVFDVRQVGFQWWIPLLMFIFGALFAVIGWAVRGAGDRDSKLKGTLFLLGGGMAILFAVSWFVSTYFEYHRAATALETHRYKVAEGVVTDFVPMPPGGHSIESFRIGTVRFAYGSGWGSTVFNSEWNTGLMHAGVQARVYYVGPDILRIEVK